MEKIADPDRVASLKQMLIAREASRASGHESAPVVIEAAIPPDAALPRDNEILERVAVAIETCPPPAEAKARAKLALARAALYTHAGTALDKLAQGSAALSPDEAGALEAIIIADGTRPSFLLTDGKPDLEDPLLGQWADLVGAHYPAMRTIARAVGRIQPSNGNASHYIGTGTLIDAGAMLVLTNYHVIHDARNKFAVAMEQDERSIRVTGTLEIDFVGEAANSATNRFRIVSVDLPVGYGAGSDGIDAAVAHVEPIGTASTLPSSVPRLSRDIAYANGGMTSLATIGFPGPPPQSQGLAGDVDWGYVTGTLFRNQFGFKRLAPGRFTGGLSPANGARRVISHDATTFGGASGSLVVAWADAHAPAFGLHFAGATGRRNHALSFAAAAAALQAVGVHFD